LHQLHKKTPKMPHILWQNRGKNQANILITVRFRIFRVYQIYRNPLFCECLEIHNQQLHFSIQGNNSHFKIFPCHNELYVHLPDRKTRTFDIYSIFC